MVRGLTVGLTLNKEETAQIELSQVPKKSDKAKFLVDGLSLAYHALESEDRDHSWDFANGGDYEKYSTKVKMLLECLQGLNFDLTIVLPYPEGTGPETESAKAKWVQKLQEKLKRVNRIKMILEKSSTSRNILDVLPQFMISTIVHTAIQCQVKVLFTRNNINRYCAMKVKEGEYDVVLGQSSDYMVFDQIKYIPVNSIANQVIDEEEKLVCSYYTTEKVCKLLGLKQYSRLIDVGILLGNDFTEPFVAPTKYNMYTALRVKQNPKYPANLVKGIVEFFNKNDFPEEDDEAQDRQLEVVTDLHELEPFKNFLENDNEFSEAVKESMVHYRLESPLCAEGSNEIIEKIALNEMPQWALAVSEGSDFWYDPVVDDYKHDVMTSDITQCFRRVMYSILGREDVIEHTPYDEDLVEKKVESEKGIPTLEQIKGMKDKKLQQIFYGLAHFYFPDDKIPKQKEDPLCKPDDDMLLMCGLSLRFLLSICFTDYSTPSTKVTPEMTKLIEFGVKCAPPVDKFEFRALALQALSCAFGNLIAEENPVTKPKMRRIHVGAMYQSIVQHLLWMRQLLMIPVALPPKSFFDGQTFGYAYDLIEQKEEFFARLEHQKRASKIEERLDQFIEMVLYPFPENLFESFNHAPRSFGAAQADDSKGAIQSISVVKSAFSALKDEDEDKEDDQAEQQKVNTPPPPPPPSSKKETKKKEEIDEDEEMAFLMAAAAENKGGPKIVQQQQQKKNKGPARRRVEKVNINDARNFHKESKLDAKLQTKQQGYEW